MKPATDEIQLAVAPISPRARVLLVAGYSEIAMADQGLGALSFEVLQKPFTPGTPVRKVREVLDGDVR